MKHFALPNTTTNQHHPLSKSKHIHLSPHPPPAYTQSQNPASPPPATSHQPSLPLAPHILPPTSLAAHRPTYRPRDHPYFFSPTTESLFQRNIAKLGGPVRPSGRNTFCGFRPRLSATCEKEISGHVKKNKNRKDML